MNEQLHIEAEILRKLITPAIQQFIDKTGYPTINIKVDHTHKADNKSGSLSSNIRIIITTEI